MSLPNWVRHIIESDAPWEVTWMLTGQMLETIPGADPHSLTDIGKYAGQPWEFNGYIYIYYLADPVGKVFRKKI